MYNVVIPAGVLALPINLLDYVKWGFSNVYQRPLDWRLCLANKRVYVLIIMRSSALQVLCWLIVAWRSSKEHDCAFDSIIFVGQLDITVSYITISRKSK